MKKVFLSVLLVFTALSIFAQREKSKNILIIKSLRAASNKAIAEHNIKEIENLLADDAVLIRGNSTHITGRDSIVSIWRKIFKENSKVSYVRTPKEIIISSNDSLAWETGTWKAANSYSGGGNYSAMWKKTNSSWKIMAELFVSLFK